MENRIKDWAREKAKEVHRISYAQLDDWHVIEVAILEAIERGQEDRDDILRECFKALNDWWDLPKHPDDELLAKLKSRLTPSVSLSEGKPAGEGMTPMKPTVTMEQYQNSTLIEREQIVGRILTERDEALTLLATERDNFGKLETELKAEASEDLARHLIQADATIMAEKRRTAALVEVAMMSSGKSRETILAEAQKLIAPSDSGGEKKA